MSPLAGNIFIINILTLPASMRTVGVHIIILSMGRGNWYMLFVGTYLFSGGCISSYIVPKEIKRNLTLCYGRTAYNDPPIPIYGFYRTTFPYTIDFTLFEDGVSVYNIASPYKSKGADEYTSTKSYLRKVARSNPDDGIASAGLKGLYQIASDTITMELINDVRGGMPTWMGLEYQFLILADRKLQFLRKRSLNSQAWTYPDHTEIYEFVPMDTLPSSYIWLMEKDWFWCEGAKENIK